MTPLLGLDGAVTGGALRRRFCPVRTPSLARMRLTWCSAVFGEMYRRAAISAFVLPWRMRSSTSRSAER